MKVTDKGNSEPSKIPQSFKQKESDIVCNLSTTKLSTDEMSVLEKGLNFCPTVKAPNINKTLDDLYFFCRKLRLKEHFYDPDQGNNIPSNNETEQCDFQNKIKNP